MPIQYSADGEPVLDPARMTAQITFLEPVQGSDASGTVTTYAEGLPPDNAWAEIVAVRGTDVIKAGQDVSQSFISATINYRAASPRTAQMRFRDARGLIYIIRSVQDVVPGMLKFQVLTSELISAGA